MLFFSLNIYWHVHVATAAYCYEIGCHSKKEGFILKNYHCKMLHDFDCESKRQFLAKSVNFSRKVVCQRDKMIQNKCLVAFPKKEHLSLGVVEVI